MKRAINNLRWLLGLPFIGLTWLFYQIHIIVDPYSDWELGQYTFIGELDWDEFFDEGCDCD